MFFIYPIGHDQATYTRPWFTLGVIAVCVLVFRGCRWPRVRPSRP
ncbi:MAG: hypothetical protein R3F43_12390 [bacterium]